MSGHLPCTATLSMSRHLSTLNYLRSADTCLTRTRTVICWLSVPAITDSVNKCSVFGGHFNQNSLAHTLTCDRQYAQYSPCCRLHGDHKQYFISRVFRQVNADAHWLHSFYDITSLKSRFLFSTRGVEEDNDS